MIRDLLTDSLAEKKRFITQRHRDPKIFNQNMPKQHAYVSYPDKAKKNISIPWQIIFLEYFLNSFQMRV